MPALPDPGPVVRIEFETQTSASIPAGSRFFCEYSGSAPSAADLNTLATAVSSAWGSHIAPLVATTENLAQVVITDLSSDVGQVGAWTGSVAGTRSGNDLIASAAVVVNHSISRRYRGGRPRTYLRAGTESDLSSINEWSGAARTAFLAGWQAFVAEVLGSTGIGISLTNIINVSWYKGNTVFTTPTGRARNISTPRTTPVLDTITNSAIAVKIGSQRRRLDI